MLVRLPRKLCDKQPHWLPRLVILCRLFMISQPLKWDGAQMLECAPAEATHLKFVVPGPVGQLCLPVMIGGTRAGTNNWTWNGSVEAPTLRPSVLTSNEREGLRCHSWINDGHAQFLDDTTHELRGQTVPLLPLDNT